MMCYSIQPRDRIFIKGYNRDRIFVKGYGFLSFAKNMD